ncbi:MAG: hypothetical protein NZ473_05655 [Candidatus Kapabacteria bacterium]|nr:hypothetical protein [Candidatus Kapabacteria bacterium]MDW8225074.1 hypothetical protein [Bacteroidota bacterium]
MRYFCAHFVLACATASLLWCEQRPTASQRNTVTLRYALQPGAEWTYELSYRLEKVENPGRTDSEGTPVATVVRIPLRCTVLSATRDTLTLREVVDSLAISVRSEEARYAWDTVYASPQAIEITHTLIPHRGPVSATLNVRDSLLWRSLDFVEGSKRFLSNRRRWLSWFLPYPAEAIPVGHTWSQAWRDSVQREGGWAFWSANVRHTLEAIVDTLGHRCARIRSEIDSLKLSSKQRTAFGEDSEERSGRGSMLTYVQLSTGLPLARQGSLDTEGSFVITGQAELLGTFEERMEMQLRRR